MDNFRGHFLTGFFSFLVIFSLKVKHSFPFLIPSRLILATTSGGYSVKFLGPLLGPNQKFKYHTWLAGLGTFVFVCPSQGF